MIQAQFELEESHIRFLEQCRTYGFDDPSATVRQALDSLRLALNEEQSLRESAALYAEVYDEDDDLKALTKSALADWPA
jgi:hypothetical protein